MSPLLLLELGTVRRRPKLQGLISLDESLALDAELRRVAEVVTDPEVPEGVVRDPEDDYLVALAQAPYENDVMTLTIGTDGAGLRLEVRSCGGGLEDRLARARDRELVIEGLRLVLVERVGKGVAELLVGEWNRPT